VKRKEADTSNSVVAEGPRDATQFAKMRDNERYLPKERRGVEKSEWKLNTLRKIGLGLGT